jgi:hypothetical protein
MFRPNVAKSVAKIWLACGHLQECGKMVWQHVAMSVENVWQHKVRSVAKFSHISSGVGQLVLNGQGA